MDLFHTIEMNSPIMNWANLYVLYVNAKHIEQCYVREGKETISHFTYDRWLKAAHLNQK